MQHPALYHPRLSGRQEPHADILPAPYFGRPAFFGTQSSACRAGERGALVVPVFVFALAERVVYKLEVMVTGKPLRLPAADAGSFWYRDKEQVSVVFAVAAHENQDDKGQLYYNVTLAEDEALAGTHSRDADAALHVMMALYDTYPGLAGDESLLAYQSRELPAWRSTPMCESEA